MHAHAGALLVIGAATFVAAPSASAALLRGPYLQQLTHDSVTVVWDTDRGAPDDPEVAFGEWPTRLDRLAFGSTHASALDDRRESHVVVVDGLSADTTYFYTVGSTTTGTLTAPSLDQRFTTAPAPGARTPFRAWIFGDSGNANSAQAVVRKAMLERTAASPPDLILHCGDMAYAEGTVEQFDRNLFEPFASVLRHTPLWPSPGNHDVVSSRSETQSGPYYEAFVLPADGGAGGVASGTEAFYSFDYANVHFVALDTSDTSLARGSPMLTWLAQDLAANEREWTISFFHHPPYSKGSHDSDLASDSEGRLVAVREHVVPILEQGGVDLVFAGHSHVYERSFLVDRVYGFGGSPDFRTPAIATLQARGRILDGGDGRAAGDGAYVKADGGTPHAGTVYVVAGHAGSATELRALHPVMSQASATIGSVLLTVDGDALTVRNVLGNGTIGDEFSIVKPSGPLWPVTTTTSTTTSTLAADGDCGNGMLDAGESCDDGDAWRPGDACSAECALVACGDVDGSGGVTAHDALRILQTASGVATCRPCVCDLNGSGGESPVTAADALVALRHAVVGAAVRTRCPPCVADALSRSAAWSLVVLPDTQFYARDASPTFDAQTRWIAANREPLDVRYVAHVGDCVENAERTTQWEHASAAFARLEDARATGRVHGIPYGVAVGNHDQFPREQAAGGATALYNLFFGERRFRGRPYYGGRLGSDNDNHLDLFTVGAMKFVVVHVEFDPQVNAEALRWADDVLAHFSDRHAIVVSHFIVSSGNPASWASQGKALYDALKRRPNLFLMLGGHAAGEGRRTDVFGGATVHTLLANYQTRRNGGDGWLRILQFVPARDEIRVFTYSPTLRRFEIDPSSQFVLPFAMR